MKVKILLSIFFFSFNTELVRPFYSSNQIKEYKNDFKLSYISVGFGSNRFTKQPMFRVDKQRFMYSLEDAWQYGDQKVEKDTLLIGAFRQSSIDSILDLISSIKDTSIYKVNTKVMSGSLVHLNISTDTKKLGYSLHNAYDTTADKIVTILNTYIPDIYQERLYISNIK